MLSGKLNPGDKVVTGLATVKVEPAAAGGTAAPGGRRRPAAAAAAGGSEAAMDAIRSSRSATSTRSTTMGEVEVRALRGST